MFKFFLVLPFFWFHYTLAEAQDMGEPLSSQVDFLVMERGLSIEPPVTEEVACRPSSTDFKVLETDLAQVIGSLYPNQSDETPLTLTVSGNWMKVNLNIINNNEDGSYLVIDHITFQAKGSYNGQELYHERTLWPGYCGLPFLYLVPSQSYQQYKPQSKNPLQNLTLIVDGFPEIKDDHEYEVTLTVIGRFVSENGENKKLFLRQFESFTVSP